MSDFIKLLISLSFSGTLLLFFVLFWKLFYKNTFSRCWQYYVWLIVAFRFLFPFTPEASITGYVFNVVEKAWAAGASQWVNSNETDNMDNTEIAVQIKEKESIYVPGNSIEEISVQYIYVFFVWSALALALIIRKVTIYQNFIRYLRAGNSEVSDIEILNLLADCEESLNIRKNVELARNPLVSFPMLVGFFHPYIIIPDESMTKEEMTCIFKHELTHYKRRDILYKWFVQIIMCIHWFNPFVYLLGKEINRACELSCDEAVIYSLNDEDKKTYGDTLFSLIKAGSGYKNQVASITMTEGARQIKERLGAIMNYKRKSKTVTAGAVLLTIMLCFNFAVAGAYTVPSAKDGNASFVIEKSRNKTYVQRTCYYNSFLFEIGWNLGVGTTDAYAYKELSLENHSKIRVYFDDNTKKYIKDEQAMTALSGLLGSLKSGTIQQPALMPAIEKPFVTKITFFSSILPYMDKALITTYAEKAEQDNKVNFFSVILNYMTTDDINRYAEKYYESGDIARFTTLVPYMTKEMKQNWRIKAQKDKKNTFYAVL